MNYNYGSMSHDIKDVMFLLVSNQRYKLFENPLPIRSVQSANGHLQTLRASPATSQKNIREKCLTQTSKVFWPQNIRHPKEKGIINGNTNQETLRKN